MNAVLKFCIFVAGLALGQVVLAQTASVTSQLVAQRVEMVAGKPVLKAAGDGKPGDVLQYSATYRNTGAAAAAKLLATVPVPPGTTFIAATDQPAQAQASTDGSTFAAMPLTRVVKLADGSTRKEPVPLADYRALRWEIGNLPAGATTAVSLRVSIDSPAVVSAAKP